MEKQKHTETAEASLEKQQKKLKNRKKLKSGGLATAITVIFVAVVVLVNVVVTQIGKRYPDFKLDLTTANLYAISDETLDYIRNMDKDVDIAISSDEATFTSDKNNKMIAETLSKYQGYSDRISAGQALGQKNTVLAIWMAYTYLDPLSSVGPGSYVLWQNLFNSYQLWKKRKNDPI